jgi:hypothetical protein
VKTRASHFAGVDTLKINLFVMGVIGESGSGQQNDPKLQVSGACQVVLQFSKICSAPRVEGTG